MTNIKFIKASVMKHVNEENPNIHHYKKLLEMIRDHQVIVIVGDIDCEKTTIVPRILHEAGYTKRGKVGCTQPRRGAAKSASTRLSEEMKFELGQEVGYSDQFEDCTSDKTIIKYMTDGVLLREFLVEHDLASYSVIMIDEAHERTVCTDVLLGLVKCVCRDRKYFKLLVISSSATPGEAEIFCKHFNDEPLFRIPSLRYDVQINYTEAFVEDYVEAAIFAVRHIHETQPHGDILVYLTGQEEILKAGAFLKGEEKLEICPFYANLPSGAKDRVHKLTCRGDRKVVLATNIAETSATIDGIKYVVDAGYSKLKSYDVRTGVEFLSIVPISKASANQRAGKAGRNGHGGECFRLYPGYIPMIVKWKKIPYLRFGELTMQMLFSLLRG